MLFFLSACPIFGGGGVGADPCTDDANACGNGGVLDFDPECGVDDALLLELGHGEGEFRSFAPGEEPELVFGAQGGVHMVLGVGIDNPEPDHLSFELDVVLSAEQDGEAETVGERTVVYAGSVVEHDAGRAELLDLVVIPDVWPDEGRRWISIAVTDACGRVGHLDHAID